ncbi:hypothetical protein EJ05DRAFT_541491 [Pseudovirgaria hyperparasitica]|uniref:Uncharacterized protein n=1 Tax=Pseudovirgaria hyperparasitica TaxID=470096 RepID=A0A6A6VVV6_9PEZI|nr:uncharacterized protein EJ05DRAFT_541491 [Pseudovirgaria hyperparasitica]KAF2753926.1 hypothetical protein EJ05DRAFT_541491 [Pseudovirgaria hyperparasitica]
MDGWMDGSWAWRELIRGNEEEEEEEQKEVVVSPVYQAVDIQARERQRTDEKNGRRVIGSQGEEEGKPARCVCSGIWPSGIWQSGIWYLVSGICILRVALALSSYYRRSPWRASRRGTNTTMMCRQVLKAFACDSTMDRVRLTGCKRAQDPGLNQHGPRAY